jgi:transposase
MSAALQDALRAQFQESFEEGLSGRAAALRRKLLPATWARWGLAIRRTGYAGAASQGRPSEKGKLEAHRSVLVDLIDQDGDMTMPELAGALADAPGVQAHPDAIGWFLRKIGFTYKKDVGRDRATPRKGKETA